MNTKQALGNWGETLVAQNLEQHGYTLLAKNYRYRTGEIDLIAKKNEYIIFVEVKTRKHTYFDLTDLITISKQRKIIATAHHFLATYDFDNKICRFDVALVEQNNHITYIPNAFTE